MLDLNGVSPDVVVSMLVVRHSKKELVVSSTNRNFEYRQGPQATHIAAPETVAASAVLGFLILKIRKNIRVMEALKIIRAGYLADNP